MSLSGARILVADDEPGILSLLKRILGTEGYEVLTATGGVQAELRLPSASPAPPA